MKEAVSERERFSLIGSVESFELRPLVTDRRIDYESGYLDFFRGSLHSVGRQLLKCIFGIRA